MYLYVCGGRALTPGGLPPQENEAIKSADFVFLFRSFFLSVVGGEVVGVEVCVVWR